VLEGMVDGRARLGSGVSGGIHRRDPREIPQQAGPSTSRSWSRVRTARLHNRGSACSSSPPPAWTG
jgi:hypothetical protein